MESFTADLSQASEIWRVDISPFVGSYCDPMDCNGQGSSLMGFCKNTWVVPVSLLQEVLKGWHKPAICKERLCTHDEFGLSVKWKARILMD